MKVLISKKVNKSGRNIFFKALNIYLTKQQVVNRKLSAISNIYFVKIQKFKLEDSRNFIHNRDAPENCEKVDRNYIFNHLEECKGVYLTLDKLIPRSNKFKASFVLTVLNLDENSALFMPLETSELTVNFNYKVCFSEGLVTVLVDLESDETANTNWLKYTFMEKFISWMENSKEDENEEDKLDSIHLIDSEEYQKLYASLKEKYGINLVSMWPENTDPKKYVYEDLAISAYLLLLWKKERISKNSSQMQSFVDLGAGNGLLVYILASEGHEGFGIDLRKRLIWDFYPKNIILKEQTIVPSDSFLFPETDWIIGNHSDELSPYIPIIAAKSSYKTNFFLLPCCPYELNGSKFQRKNCNKSQYLDFMDFLKKISAICKFKNVEIDRLKIPSTKRICIIGSDRKFEENLFEKVCQEIQEFVESKTDVQEFKPREVVEKVRNCTTIDSNVSNEIVRIIFQELLKSSNSSEKHQNWNQGGELELSEAVQLIDKEKLKILKSECGGLQTLLRNNYQTFAVIGGKIKIRSPEKIGDQKFNKTHKKKEEVIRTKPCYFYKNHPDSCPLKEEDCSYKH